MSGLNDFILVVKIDSLTDYHSNHYEITTIDNADIIRRLGTIALIKNEDISDYNHYVFNKHLKLVSIDVNFIPENKQIIILLNKSIKLVSPMSAMIQSRIVAYLDHENTVKFLQQATKSFYRNIAFSDFVINGLP